MLSCWYAGYYLNKDFNKYLIINITDILIYIKWRSFEIKTKDFFVVADKHSIRPKGHTPTSSPSLVAVQKWMALFFRERCFLLFFLRQFLLHF